MKGKREFVFPYGDRICSGSPYKILSAVLGHLITSKLSETSLQ